MQTDRWTGLFFIAFGVLLYAVIIPWQVETADYGWLRPRTLPRIVAAIIVICGVVLAVKPAADARPGAFHWGRAALFAGLLGLGLWAMSWFGFVIVAPPLALALMWLAFERRPLWLALGAVGMPALIWLVVAVFLERPLP